jgi:zinc D-Ala-D-Ala carboxypeptidase
MILEPVRNHYDTPFVPNSGFRCLELNRAIGSSDTSQHTTGEAVDFEVPGVPNKDLALWVKDNCKFDQLILEFYKDDDPASGWVHCSYVIDGDNRHSARIFDGKTWSDL